MSFLITPFGRDSYTENTKHIFKKNEGGTSNENDSHTSI